MKKTLSLVASALLGPGICFAQNGEIHFDKLRFNNLPFYVSKTQVVQRLGQPLSVAEPHYECGFLSGQEQGKKFYELRYGSVVFIGTTTSKYQLEHVAFPANKNVTLNYGQWKFTHQTTVRDLKQIFGPSLKPSPQPNGKVLIFVASGQEGAVFTLTAGRLTRFEYWSPC